jgi:DNA-binding winged helix-turn-helix (wHTH) protein/Tol biopolymer transport system component
MEDARRRYLEFGEFRLDTYERVLTRDGETVPLTFRCYDLLFTFLNNGGHLLTHEELMRSVWNDAAVDRSSLKQTIATLRKILGDIHEQPRYIQTVPKFGYRFVADVAARADENLILVAERKSLTILDVEERGFRGLAGLVVRRSILAWMALIAVVAAAGYFVVGRGSLDLFRTSKAAAAPSFENLSWRKFNTAGNVSYAVVSPNAQFVAYVAGEENGYQSLRLLSVVDLSEITLVAPALVHYWSVAFTNDGGQIYFARWDENGSSRNGVLYRVSTLGGKVKKVVEDVEGGVDFSPDGSRLVFLRLDREAKQTSIVTANALDGSDEQTVLTSPAENPVSPVGWSPDGSRILLSASERRDDGTYSYLAEIPSMGGVETPFTVPRKQRLLSAKWTDRGAGIIVNAVAPGSNVLQIYYVSYPDGSFTHITNDLNNYFFPNVSADGRNVVATEQQRLGDIWVSDIGNPHPRKLTRRSSPFETLVWATNEQIISDSKEDGKFHLSSVDAGSGEQERISPDQLDSLRPTVSGDGKYMAFLSNRAGQWQIWRTRSDGTEPIQVTSANESIADMHFGLNENDIFYQRYEGSTWTLARVTSGGEPTTFLGDTNVGVWNVSPDGRWLVCFVDDNNGLPGRLLMRSLKDGQDYRYLDLNPSEFVAFMPDNKSLITKLQTGDSPQATLWQIPLDTGKPKKLISNPPDNIYSAAVSPDGKRLAWVQGKLVSNIVMLTRQD